MIATTIEQSRKLEELGIDISTADMCYAYYSIHNGLPTDDYILNVGKGDDLDIPAWSLSALPRQGQE